MLILHGILGECLTVMLSPQGEGLVLSPVTTHCTLHCSGRVSLLKLFRLCWYSLEVYVSFSLSLVAWVRGFRCEPPMNSGNEDFCKYCKPEGQKTDGMSTLIRVSDEETSYSALD